MDNVCVFTATFPDGYIIRATKHDKFIQQIGWRVNATNTSIDDVKFSGEVLTKGQYRDKYIAKKDNA
jgi:hypothetical protein